MNSFEINVLSVENADKGFESINTNDLLTLLPRLERDCSLRLNSTRTFYTIFHDYNIPPPIDSIREVLIQFILENDKFVPYIALDLEAGGTNEWDYYLPNKIEKNVTRIILPYIKKVLLKRQDKNIKLLMPANKLFDIISINNIDIIDIKKIKNLFLTAKYYTELNYNFFRDDDTEISSKDERNKYKILLKEVELDDYMKKFKKQVESFMGDVIYPKYIYSKYQFIGNTIIYNLYKNIVDYYKYNVLDIENLKIQKQNMDRTIQSDLEKVLTSKEVLKNVLIKNIIKTSFRDIYLKFKDNFNKISYKTLFSHMKDNDIRYIDKRYNTIIDYKNSTKDNNCEHIEIVRKFRKEKTVQAKIKYFKILKDTFVKDPNINNNFITCKVCSFDLICPHIMSTWMMIYNNNPDIEIRKKLDDYKSSSGSIHQDFCCICNEVLFDANYNEIQGETYRILYKELFKYLWGQTLNIYSILKITPKMNIFDFGGIVVYGILPVITKSNIPYVKSQINIFFKNNELNIEIKAYIILYIYSYILNIIRVSMFNPNKGYIKITLQEEIKGRNISDYAKALIEHFSTSYRFLYNKLDSSDLTDMLLNIYTELSKTDSEFAIKRSNKLEKVIFDEIIKNTIFNYSYNIALLNNYIQIDNYENMNIDQYEHIVEKILGATIMDIATDRVKNDFLLVYQPDYEGKDSKNISEYKKIISQDKIKISQFDMLFKGRTLYSYKVYMERYKKIIEEKYDIDNDKELEFILDGEKKIKKTVSIFYKIITDNPEFFKKWKRRKYTNDDNITAILSESGILYKWNIIVYDDGTEISSKDEEIKTYKKIVNYRDEITKILKTNTYKNSVSITTEEYYKKSKKDSFFNFYRVRCPIKGIHEFEKSICIKCKKQEEKQENEYFKKYYKQYYEQISSMYQTEKELKIKSPRKIKSDWKYNERTIIEVSSLTKIDKNIILSIGSMEFRTIDQIKENKKMLNPPESLYDPQISLPLSHYYWLVRTYNIMKNSQIEDLILLDMFKKDKVNILEMVNYKKNLPNNLFERESYTIDSVLKDKDITYKDIQLCTIQMICSFILKISKINNYLKSVSIILMKYIIYNEIYTSKGNDKFDRTLLRRSNQVVIEADQNDNFDISDINEDSYMKEGDLDYSDVDWIVNT